MYKLARGVFLEDRNILLEWGKPIEELATENGAEIVRKTDRAIIQWGTHIILNGLELELSNVFLVPDNYLGAFNFIEARYAGDNQSFKAFDLISKHLLNLFGKPNEREDDIEQKGSRDWTWYNTDAKITLYLFEQHEFKLHFKIERQT